MIEKQAFKEQIRKLMPLAIPILLAQVTMQSMGVVDTIVAGRAGPVEMSGVAVGASFGFLLHFSLRDLSLQSCL